MGRHQAYRTKSFIMIFMQLFVTLNVTVVVIKQALVGHQELLSFKFETSSEERFIQYTCTEPASCGDWDDRLKGILSTYALSKILNRTFLLNITQPCFFNTTLFPNKHNWNLGHHLKDRGSIYDLDIKYNRGFKAQLESERYLIDLMTDLRRYDFVNVRSSLLASDSLVKNKFGISRLRLIGYHDPASFKVNREFFNWYNELFQLAPRMVYKYKKMMRKVKPQQSTFLICAQVKLGRERADALPLGTSKHFWRFINRTFVDELKRSNRDYRIFVTTDHEHIKKEASSAFDQDVVVSNPDPIVNMDLDFANLGEDCDQVESVVLDFHLFQHCDAVVVSSNGFGVLGAWNRPDPLKNFYVFVNQELKMSKFVFRRIKDLENDLNIA